MHICCSAFAFQGAVKEVAAVELDAGLGGVDPQQPAGSGLIYFRSFSDFAACPVQYPVVIVAFAEMELLVVRLNPFADPGGLLEIKWRRGYWPEFAGGNQRGIYGRKS